MLCSFRNGIRKVGAILETLGKDLMEILKEKEDKQGRFTIMSYIGNSSNRKTNEDACDTMSIYLQTDPHNPVYIGIVCDGLGGMGKGDFASNFVIQYFKECIWYLNGQVPTFEDLREHIHWVVDMINSKLMLENKLKGTTAYTTVAILCSYLGEELVYNVGDTRIYRVDLETQEVDLLSQDHSKVELEYRMGKIETLPPLNDKERSKLMSCIGQGVNMLYYESKSSLSRKTNRKVGYVLATDGFWSEALEEDYIRIVENPEENLSQAFTKVMERGSLDNITVVILNRNIEKEERENIRIEDEESATEEIERA